MSELPHAILTKSTCAPEVSTRSAACRAPSPTSSAIVRPCERGFAFRSLAPSTPRNNAACSISEPRVEKGHQGLRVHIILDRGQDSETRELDEIVAEPFERFLVG